METNRKLENTDVVIAVSEEELITSLLFHYWKLHPELTDVKTIVGSFCNYIQYYLRDRYDLDDEEEHNEESTT